MNAESPGQGPVVDVYARLSYAANGDEINVNEQIEWCSAEVVNRGGRVGEVFKDNSLSAWKPKVVRPDWNKLMARLESGASDGVMVLDLYRFSRKVIEGERLVELASQGILVWSLSGSYDLTTADGRRHFREAIVAAAGESDKISERVMRGHARGAKRGRRPGGRRGFGLVGLAPKPEGWEPGDPRELVSNDLLDAERDIVRECYRRLLGGETLSSVVRSLRARDIRTTDGNHWQRFTLAQALRMPGMAGLRARNGEVVAARKDMEPIVSREEWERLCALFDGRKRGRPAGRRHLLTGLVRCGGCGSPMIAQLRTTVTRPYPDGSPCREYRCRSNADRPLGCGKNYMDGLIADRAVAQAVKERLSDPRHVDQVARRLAHSSKRREELTQEIARLDDTADNLAVKVETWGEKRVDKAMAPILKRLTELNQELAALDDTNGDTGGALGEDVAAVWDRAEAAGDVDVLRAMVRRAFPALTLRPHSKSGDFAVTRFDWDGHTLSDTL